MHEAEGKRVIVIHRRLAHGDDSICTCVTMFVSWAGLMVMVRVSVRVGCGYG